MVPLQQWKQNKLLSSSLLLSFVNRGWLGQLYYFLQSHVNRGRLGQLGYLEQLPASDLYLLQDCSDRLVLIVQGIGAASELTLREIELGDVPTS